MELQLFRTFWGERRDWSAPLAEIREAGFDGVEARLPPSPAHAAILRDSGLAYIAVVLTGGGVIPAQAATLDDHLKDLKAACEQAVALEPRFLNVLGGNDRWPVSQQVAFIVRAQEIAGSFGLVAVFETHRARILSSPWATLDVIAQHPAVLLALDVSHWVVGCERLLNDPADDLGPVIARTHHVHARVGYDQGPQVPHPAAPEHAADLAFHQDLWERVWRAQAARGFTQTTMTPEFGPDGYLHSAPFSRRPVADLWSLNRWMGDAQRRHFAQISGDL